MKKISIKGARTHNLKNISLEIPHGKLVVFAGVSGSGKSSLAFDTIFAEGHRRYIESLSSYARHFLGQMEKPDVDVIDGLSPAIAIDQKTTSRNPRSTVGTITEIYDYLRLLYARAGIPHCPVCKKEICALTTDQIVDKILKLKENSKLCFFAPIIKNSIGEHCSDFEKVLEKGFTRARVDGEIMEISGLTLKKGQKHNAEILVDRIVLQNFDTELRSRIAEAVDAAFEICGGTVVVNDSKCDLVFSKRFACVEHDIAIGEMSPQMFSFNNPLGACKKCHGLGFLMKVDVNMIIPNPSLSIAEGGIRCSNWSSVMDGNLKSMWGESVANMYFSSLAKKYNFSLSEPISKIPSDILKKMLYGTGEEELELIRKGKRGDMVFRAPFEGVITNLERRFRETKSEWIKNEISSYMSNVKCNECDGMRLNTISLNVRFNGKTINEFCDMTIKNALEFVKKIKKSSKNDSVSVPILREIFVRLGFLHDVGLGYITLSRTSGTLSGGEAQRIRLATQIGSSLSGVIYVLDEPSIGLHQRDNNKLIATLKNLRDLGNSLIVVEHDEDTIKNADWIVDIGPGAGTNGGHVVAVGTADEISVAEESITGKYLSGRIKIPVPAHRRKGNGHFLEVVGAKLNNLKSINVKIPLGTMVCVTGVSGSGKSTLVNEIIYNHLAAELNNAKRIETKAKFYGKKFLDKVICVDQSPIGRTPRSNPATYTGVFTDIRDLFACTKEARAHGFGGGRFSFNVKGGRCEACQGDGVKKIEMHFLPDVYIKCEVCGGKRYNKETLKIKYKGKNIDDVLKMTVDEACVFFSNIVKIRKKLEVLSEVGMGYTLLEQSATTLSGGEAQRVKLAAELGKRSTGKTFYVLDEPTTGLHTADVHKLIIALGRLVECGNTVLVIEHNLDLIKTADYIIDLGPDAGDSGGKVVAAGTPEEICTCMNSYTGRYLKKYISDNL